MYVLCTRNFQDTELAKVNARDHLSKPQMLLWRVLTWAYHSGSFVGNHVHLTLKVHVWYNNNYGNVQIHDSVGHIFTASEHEGRGPSIVQRTFSVAFDLFSKCDNIYNKCVVTEEEIACLGKCIMK